MKAHPTVGPCFFALLGETLFVSRSFILVLCWMPLFCNTKAVQCEEMILQDKPSLYSRFNEIEGIRIPSKPGNFFANILGKVDIVSPGPPAKHNSYFNSDNKITRFSGGQHCSAFTIVLVGSGLNHGKSIGVTGEIGKKIYKGDRSVPITDLENPVRQLSI